MRFDAIELPKPDPGPTGAGVARPIENYLNGAVAVTLTGGSVRVEASNDGTNWGTIGGTVSAVATTFVPVPHAVKLLRLFVVTAIAAGDKAVFGAHLQEGD